ncbi:MAG: ketosteroid isomerase-like protein [Flavobacteriales bacterium]|jgi:ketosteroid isomerase-like protein
MKPLYLLAIGLLSATIGCQEISDDLNEKENLQTISALMQAQENAWNEGDLDRFMSSYMKSDSLSFIGSRGLSKGWQTTLDNYKKSYPNKEQMGRLQFENLQMEQLAASSAFVLGKWTLYRNADTLSGHYSLIWKKLEAEWVIVADHSS